MYIRTQNIASCYKAKPVNDATNFTTQRGPSTYLPSTIGRSKLTSDVATGWTIFARRQSPPCRKVCDQNGGCTVSEQCVMGIVDLKDTLVVPSIYKLSFSFTKFCITTTYTRVASCILKSTVMSEWSSRTSLNNTSSKTGRAESRQ